MRVFGRGKRENARSDDRRPWIALNSGSHHIHIRASSSVASFHGGLPFQPLQIVVFGAQSHFTMSSDYQTHMPADGLGIVPFRKAGGFSQALVQTRSQNDYNASIIGSINGISEPSSVGEGQLPIAGRQAHINVKRELGRWQIFVSIILNYIGTSNRRPIVYTHQRNSWPGSIRGQW